MTRVVIDARLSGNSGIGRYIDCLWECFGSEQHVFEFELVLPPGRDKKGASRVHRNGFGPYSKLGQLAAPFQLPSAPIFWTPHWNHPLLASPGRANIITVHDVMPLRFPDLYPRLQRSVFRLFIETAVSRQYQIITVSQFSAQELRCFFPAARIEVIANGVLRLPKGDAGIDGDYFLCVGNVKPHKNLAFVVRSFRLAKERGLIDQPVRLVVAGAVAGLRSVDTELLEAAQGAEDVVFVAGPSDAVLGALYSDCIGLVAASLYEGFGLPIVEAMSFGKQIVCSDIPAFREVGGDQVHYFDPRDPDHFVSALAESYACRGLQPDYTDTIASFSWSASAHAHLSLLARVGDET